MRYTQITPEQAQQMLGRIGASSMDELFAGIPPEHRLRAPLDIPAGLSELELTARLHQLADRNHDCRHVVCFLGAGAYDHFIPSVVDALAAQGSFLTGYTPYQAEASQGSLQTFYEFQTMICQLTGMDIANASLYEVATAVTEAVLMARAVNGRNRVLVSRLIGPESRSVLETTLRDQPDVKLQTIGMADGLIDLNGLSPQIGNDTAAVVVQSPNFLGGIEPIDRIAELTHARKALLIVITDPISAGVLKTVGELGADIAVGEGQALGIPLSLGGPYLGLLACRQEHMRRLPGRLVGQTTDRSGRVGYCLTLQTREQHIRREKATSNVCTNQGLMAVRAAVYMAAMGRQGIQQVASLCLDKAHYAAEQIARLPGFSFRFGAPFFKEFCIRTTKPITRLLAHARRRGILAGVPLECWFPELKDCFLIAVTEKRTKSEIDQMISVLGEDVS